MFFLFMDAKSTTNWDLHLSLVTDVDTQAHDYVPDELTQRLNGVKPSKYLTVNNHIIYPSQKDFGFEVKSVHHNSALTNSDFPLDLSKVGNGTIVPVSLVYPFKEFPGRDMADEVNTFDYLTHPGRIIDVQQGELENLLGSTKKEFADRLRPFGIELEPAKTYFRFFLY